MKRRAFLHHVSHSIAIPSLVGSFGLLAPKRLSSFLRLAADTDKVLVLIYLQGGNDGLNTVVPLDQLSSLNIVRPQVVLPESAILKLNGTQVGLHPSLSGFRSLYQEGRLEIIQSVGYPQQNYSHFRSNDIWMSGSDSTTYVNSGWTGRYLNHEHPDFPIGYPNTTVPDPLAIELGYGSSMLFQGPTANMSMVISNPNAFYQLVDNLEETAPDTDAGDKLRYIRLTARQSQQYGQVVKQAADKVTLQPGYDDNNSLAQQLKIVARLIAGGLQTSLYLVRLGGFDTHSTQVSAGDHTKGQHAMLLSHLNDAVISFMNDLRYQKVDDQVIGMTFSEFGRRITSNGSGGTDHGSALPLFVFGNKVQGGVLGTNPVIPSNATNENNLEMQFDFKQVYTSILEQWFGVPEIDRENILMNSFGSIPVIRDSSITGLSEKNDSKTFNVYPNPLSGMTTIEFISAGQAVSIEAIDVQGRKTADIFSGSLPVGKQVIPWNAGQLAAGRYFILLHSAAGSQAKSVVKW